MNKLKLKPNLRDENCSVNRNDQDSRTLMLCIIIYMIQHTFFDTKLHRQCNIVIVELITSY